jgi:hypothetical protein
MNETDKINKADLREFMEKKVAPAFSEALSLIQKWSEENHPDNQPSSDPPSLFEEQHWLVTNDKDYIAFFNALVDLAPDGSLLQISGSPDPDVEEVLRQWLKEPSQQIIGRWRTSAIYEAPITSENMATLARLAQNHAEPEVADQFLVFHGEVLILHWHDAPVDPIYISCSMPESKVSLFAERLDATLKKEPGITT